MNMDRQAMAVGGDPSDSAVQRQIENSMIERVQARHPTWQGQIDFTDVDNVGAVDLSLLKLDTPINSLETYALRSEFPAASSDGVLVGYGEDDNGQYGTQRVGDTTLRQVGTAMIEVGDPANICSGDSGGPLFTEEDGEQGQAGEHGTNDAEDISNLGYALALLGCLAVLDGLEFHVADDDGRYAGEKSAADR